MLRAALARRFRALPPALASPFASSARATVAEVAVPFTVVGLDGARHRCVGREGHSLVKGMQQAKLPLALMGINGYDAALRLPREWHDKVPEMDLAQVRHQRPVHFPQWRECAASGCAPPPERTPPKRQGASAHFEANCRRLPGRLSQPPSPRRRPPATLCHAQTTAAPRRRGARAATA